ncbi:hypothetical protein ACIRP2_17690 [Streptomyces sp. NPDC101194]|uniref:hypothetical protein n=1 Tax=Streptomyces sp. NPDC101194 TaxID=3366127 RepID=UPI00382CAF6E
MDTFSRRIVGWSWGGRGLLALGVGVAVHEVRSAPDGQKGEAAVPVGSTLAGGLGGSGGGRGGRCGDRIDHPGAGTAGGGVVGGIAGSPLGSNAGDFFNSLW